MKTDLETCVGLYTAKDTLGLPVKIETSHLLIEKCKQISHDGKNAVWECRQQRSHLCNARYHIVWICNKTTQKIKCFGTLALTDRSSSGRSRNWWWEPRWN